MAEITVVVAIVISLVCLVARLIMLKGMIGLSLKEFMNDVCLRVLLVCMVSVIFPLLSASLLPEGFAGFVASVLICLASAGCSAAFIGLKRSERRELMEMFRKGGAR